MAAAIPTAVPAATQAAIRAERAAGPTWDPTPANRAWRPGDSVLTTFAGGRAAPANLADLRSPLRLSGGRTIVA